MLLTEEIRSHLSKYPTPKIQKMCLVDLPVELLEIIMDYGKIEQARLLSATCSHLRRIGLRFIYVVCISLSEQYVNAESYGLLGT
jgi:hypothetical protein